MGNTIISYPDRTLDGYITSDDWQTYCPIYNVQDKDQDNMNTVARSKIYSIGSVVVQPIYIDLGAVYAIQCLGLLRHNLTYYLSAQSGRVRYRAYSDSGYTTQVYDSGEIFAFPSGMTLDTYNPTPKNWIKGLASAVSARYWQIDIYDLNNVAGYVEFSRIWLGEATFMPAVSVDYGLSLGFGSNDVTSKSLGGVRWGRKGTPARTFAAQFSSLTLAEKHKALQMMCALTTVDEALWIMDYTASAESMLWEAFVCCFEELSALQYPYYNNNTLPLKVVEKL